MSDEKQPCRKGRRLMYDTWRQMRLRCEDPGSKYFKYYGARGITVCERWRTFQNFLDDMWPRPEGRSLDRIDNDKGYGPDNCRWATKLEQVRNTRSNRVIEFGGERMPISAWAERLGLNVDLREALLVALAPWKGEE